MDLHQCRAAPDDHTFADHAFADHDSDGHSHTDEHGDAYVDGDVHSDSNGHSYSNSDGHSYGDKLAHTCAHYKAYRHSNGDAHATPSAHRHSQTHPPACASHAYSHSPLSGAQPDSTCRRGATE